jgi:hypothetical protein
MRPFHVPKLELEANQLTNASCSPGTKPGPALHCLSDYSILRLPIPKLPRSLKTMAQQLPPSDAGDFNQIETENLV